MSLKGYFPAQERIVYEPRQLEPLFNPDLLRKGFDEWFNEMFGRNGKFRPSDSRQAGHMYAAAVREGGERLFQHLIRMSYEQRVVKQPDYVDLFRQEMEKYRQQMEIDVRLSFPNNHEVVIVGKPCKVKINVTIPKQLK